jgi:hypothetical protein
MFLTDGIADVDPPHLYEEAMVHFGCGMGEFGENTSHYIWTDCQGDVRMCPFCWGIPPSLTVRTEQTVLNHQLSLLEKEGI